jgi:hypothetical protein
MCLDDIFHINLIPSFFASDNFSNLLLHIYIYSQGAEEEEWLNEFDPAILQQFLDGTCLRLAILIESILDECFPQL